jgi:MFS superfamily sulfate permease-like transporter
LSNKLEKIIKEQGEHSVAAIDVKHDLEVIEVKMNRYKGLAHNYRKKIRAMKFVGVETDMGMLFWPKDNVPSGVETDGRVWRIKVKNKVLQTDKLLMMGGGAVVGKIPAGLPTLNMPRFNLSIILKLLPYAAIISLLGFMEAISIAKAMAAKTGQRLDPNQELIGQGLSNIIGSIAKSYPVSGSFSRSAVNLQAGAVTGLSSVFTSLAVVICLLFFTPLLYHLPQAVLAAVIMMAVIGLINVSGFIHAWKAQWYDGAISIISFICTLAFAPHLDKGIMVGVGLSLIVFLYKSTRPTVARLAMHEDLALKNAEAYSLNECGYVAAIRFDGPLFFANASYLEDKVTEIMQTRLELKHILIVGDGINDMDASGEEALSLLVDRVRSAGHGISFAELKENVIAVMKRTHLWEKIGEENIYAHFEDAIEEIYYKTHTDSTGGSIYECPLLSYVPK